MARSLLSRFRVPFYVAAFLSNPLVFSFVLGNYVRNVSRRIVNPPSPKNVSPFWILCIFLHDSIVMILQIDWVTPHSLLPETISRCVLIKMDRAAYRLDSGY